MGYLTNILTILICIASVLVIGQASMIGINPTIANSDNYTILSCKDLPQSVFGSCNETTGDYTTDTNNWWNQTIKPESSQGDILSGLTYSIVNIITSAFTWMTSPITAGYKIVNSVVRIPVIALTHAHLPPVFIWVIGLAVTVMLIFWIGDWIKGGFA